MCQSSRWLEEQAELATGTLSKLRTGSGRVKLTRAKLLKIAAVLGVSPEMLVADTCFVELLLQAPSSPDSERTASLAAEVDELRADLAGRAAMLATLQEQAAASQTELAVVQADVRRVHEENLALRERAARGDDAVNKLRSALGEALRSGAEARAEVTAVASRLSAVAAQCERWRSHALEREQRVAQLEGILAQVEQQFHELQQRPRDQTGGFIVGALLGLGLGSAGTGARRGG